MTRNPKNMRVAIGLLIMSAGQVVAHYAKIPDLALGTIMGIGLGLLLLSFRNPNRPAHT